MSQWKPSGLDATAFIAEISGVVDWPKKAEYIAEMVSMPGADTKVTLSWDEPEAAPKEATADKPEMTQHLRWDKNELTDLWINRMTSQIRDLYARLERLEDGR